SDSAMMSMPAVSMTPAPPTGAAGEEALRSGDVMSTPGGRGRRAPAGGGAGMRSGLPRWPDPRWPAAPGTSPGAMRPVPTAPSPIQPATGRLLSVGPSRVDHIPAFRIALGLAIPLSVLLARGHTEWAMYVGFGAFTGIYSRYEPTRMRFRR